MRFQSGVDIPVGIADDREHCRKQQHTHSDQKQATEYTVILDRIRKPPRRQIGFCSVPGDLGGLLKRRLNFVVFKQIRQDEAQTETEDEENNQIDAAPHAQQIVKIKLSQPAQPWSLIRTAKIE